MTEQTPQPTAQEVLAVLQQRFPREFEIAVLQATLAKVQQRQQEGEGLKAVEAESETA